MILTLTDLAVGYGRKAIATGINAQFESGQLVCLQGRNGTGKSTLLRTISTFQTPVSGEISLDGNNIFSLSRKQLAQTIGVVLTQRPEAENITVRELVSLGRSPYTGFFGTLSADDKRIVGEALTLVGIEQLAGKNISCISDGERQKAMIAKALAQQTPIILLDEPTAFLDYESKVELFQLLRRIAQEEDKLIILSTHEPALAEEYSNHQWKLDSEQ